MSNKLLLFGLASIAFTATSIINLATSNAGSPPQVKQPCMSDPPRGSHDGHHHGGGDPRHLIHGEHDGGHPGKMSEHRDHDRVHVGKVEHHDPGKVVKHDDHDRGKDGEHREKVAEHREPNRVNLGEYREKAPKKVEENHAKAPDTVVKHDDHDDRGNRDGKRDGNDPRPATSTPIGVTPRPAMPTPIGGNQMPRPTAPG